MCITVQNKPAAFTEKQIIDVYKGVASLKKFEGYHRMQAISDAPGVKRFNWEIKLGLIYIEGYDLVPSNETVITRYVNDEEG